MKNLENYGVLEMDIRGQTNLGGGTVPPWIWQASVATFLYNIAADWDENVNAFNRGSSAGAELFN